MKKITLLVTITYACLGSLYAAVPAGYYNSLEGKTGGEAILETLYAKINEHTDVGYNALWTLYESTDVVGNNTIWDMYSYCDFTYGRKQCGDYKNVCDCYNREHSVPQSWFNKKAPMVSDAFHIYPVDGKVNNQRSNYPFGECSDGESLGEKARGRLGNSTFPGYSGKVFEPDDEFKGDFARTYFYMTACYRNINFTNGEGEHVFTYTNSIAGLTPYAVNLFLKWHRQDPVSDKERLRNEAVYAKQNNRNPFIDYPCLAEYIWGDFQQEAVSLENIVSSYDSDFEDGGCYANSGTPRLLSPVDSSTLEVGKANLNAATSVSVEVRGRNLTEDLHLELTNDTFSYYSISANTLSASAVNGGISVDITYTPREKGSHWAKLVIKSSEVGKRLVILHGSCKADLVSPDVAVPILITSEQINTTTDREIRVQGVNLTSGLEMILEESEYSQFYSLSPTTLTAEEVMQGKIVQISYRPTMIGDHPVRLLVTSLNKEFNTQTILIQGSCDFSVDVRALGVDSARIHWNDAGVGSYLVDVYQSIPTGEVDDTIFTDPCTDLSLVPSSTGYVAAENEGLRLGSGSKLGSITYSSLNIEQGTTVVLQISPYSNDANVGMLVTFGETRSHDTILSSGSNEYIFTADADYTSITISTTATKKRLYVEQVIVIKKGVAERIEHLRDYPKTVENALFETIKGLTQEQTYNVVVTPRGLEKYGVEIEYTMGDNPEDPGDNPEDPGDDPEDPSALCKTSSSNLIITRNGQVLTISNIVMGSYISIYDCRGNRVAQRLFNRLDDTAWTLTLPHSIYQIVQQLGSQMHNSKIIL